MMCVVLTLLPKQCACTLRVQRLQECAHDAFKMHVNVALHRASKYRIARGFPLIGNPISYFSVVQTANVINKLQ